MKANEDGSATVTVLAAVASLFLVTMYVQNTSTHMNQATKKLKIDQNVEGARINNLSNLSMLRSLMNSSKVGTNLFEPAVYPSNYFAETWNMKANDLRPQNVVSIHDQNFKINTFAESTISFKNAEAYFQGNNPRSQLSDMTSQRDLTILSLNPDPTHKYWIRSVDVMAKNTVASDSTTPLNSVGRIQLAAPEPGPVTLYIAQAGSTVWTTDFGTAASPLPPGKYKFQLRASGVVLFGEITRPTGGSMILGMNDSGITHSCNNIHAVDEILGETIDIELGENKNETTTVTVPSADTGSLSATTTHNADCSFSVTPLSGGSASGGGGAVVTGGTTTSVASTPAEIKLGIKIYQVDGEESARSFDQTVYITKTVTTTTVAQSIPGSSTTAGGARCSNRCPIDRTSIFGDYMGFLTRSFIGGPDKTQLDVRRDAESDGLPNPGGAICGNMELVAQDLVNDMGGVLPTDIDKQTDYQRLWDIVKTHVETGGSSMHYERFYAYIAPSCGRELIGLRNGCGCFAAHTLLRMGDGTERKASEIRQGDVLWNPQTNRPQQVRQVIVGPEVPLLYVFQIGGQIVEVTKEHPFLTTGGLKSAETLKVGDIILSNGSHISVEKIEREDRALDGQAPDVWNFELEGSDNDADHFVLANGVMTGDLYLQTKLKNMSRTP